MSDTAPIRLLLVDDEAALREPLAEYLSRQGFSVTEAASAAQARSVLRDETPDLVLLDIMMPGTLNGLEVCRQIKADHATRFTKVVLLTARVQASDKEAGLAAGADDYLMKPFSTLQVLETIYRMEAEA